ncbi:P22_AR N-terminal domain-containing protein [Novosphingobium sp. CF614]|uniref:phage antirepressor N-terminal domain-containing protein n=1 Tax=Novosphingobium sp. CF614 TaxID=1884364 RepID=UPI0008EFEAB3|nr:phage antirepressor N-terminal domain-containing protein [Novosphingobium sp. CF614]SFG08763.1 P22_AR N-terminal domain-containing protein [Novosphingobium sp. CF614]
MTDNRYLMIPFHGTDLTAVEINGELHVALKPVCEAIGIDWSSQRKRIMRDAILSTCVVITTMQVPGEIQNREVMTLPISHLNGFLFGITASRTKPEVMESLIVYQRECYRVLHDYWIKGAAINPRFATPAMLPTNEITRLVSCIKAEDRAEIREMFHRLLSQLGARFDFPVPPLPAFGAPAPDDLEIAEAFFAALLELQAGGVEFKHHRRDDLLAISLPETGKMLRDAGIEVPPNRRLWKALPKHHAYLETTAVNCRDDKFRHCWIFDRAKLPGFHPA